VTSPRPDDALAREANVLARYLLDVDCPPELAERYADALALRTPHSQLQTPNSNLPTPAERVAAYAIARPWSLPYIAAAAPFFGAGALLRERLTVLSAILETTPRFAADFMPRDLSLPRLLLVVASQSLLAGARLVLGFPLLFVARLAR
jgi:hypothetical protein